MNKISIDVKKFEGNVLGIGMLDDSILKSFLLNNNINVDIILNNNLTKNIKSDYFERIDQKQGKKINFKKIKKTFKKHKTDYIICNIDDILDYRKYFIKDSVYITNKKIYIYSDNKDFDIKSILKKYQRYNLDVIDKKKYIVINCQNYKYNPFKSYLYFVMDTFENIFDHITNFLAN